jgi:hypothetical protein
MHRIASLDVDSESDINWKSLSDPMWNMWSSHCLQQKWRYLKASLNNVNGVVGHRGEYKLLILPTLYIRFLIDVVYGLVAWIATKRTLPMGSTPIISTPSVAMQELASPCVGAKAHE